MRRSDVLLLDEPTNHLDLDAVLWLEDYLRAYPGALLLISHDREFLDRVVEAVVHIEHETLTLYTGNYSSFEQQRAAQRAGQQADFARQQREIAHIRSYIDRFKTHASKARQAQSRMKALERMELIAPAHVDTPFRFAFRDPQKIPNPLVDAGARQRGVYAAAGVRRREFAAGAGRSRRVARPERRRQVDVDQSARGNTGRVERRTSRGAGRAHRLLRAASAGAVGYLVEPVAARAAPRSACAGAGLAEFSRRLRLFRRCGAGLRGAVLRRREGAFGAGAARLSTAERAVARRADQSSGPRDAARVDGGVAGFRRGDGDRLPRPVLAAQRHRSVADGGRRQRAGLRRRSRRVSGLAQPSDALGKRK